MTIHEEEPTPQRPRTRGECPPVDADLGWRLCPWAGCRHHLYLDVLNGQVVTLDGDLATLARERPMCALDVADMRDDEGASMEEIGDLLGIDASEAQNILSPVIGKLRRDEVLRIHADYCEQAEEPAEVTTCADLCALIGASGMTIGRIARLAGISVKRARHLTRASARRDSADWLASQWHTAIAIAHVLGFDISGSGEDYEHARECWRCGVDV